MDGLDLLGLTGSSEILEEFPDGRWFPIFRRFISNAHVALEKSEIVYMHQILRGPGAFKYWARAVISRRGHPETESGAGVFNTRN